MAYICVHARTMAGSVAFSARGKPQSISSPTPHVAVHAKLTERQRNERSQLQSRESPFGTPVVDWLLETSPYSQFLQPGAIEDLRDRERKIAHIEDIGEKLRRLRIAIANKNRQPWNAGKKHSPETIQKIRNSIHKIVHDPALIEDRKRRVAEWQESEPDKVQEARRKASESLRARWGLQVHRRANVMIHHTAWRRENMWDQKPKTKRKATARRTRARSAPPMTEKEREEHRAQTRKRKSLAQKELWKNPEYRQRQLQSIRAASNSKTVHDEPRRKRRSVEQLRRALRLHRQQLSQAEHLVPQLETVVEKLGQEDDTAVGSSFAMEQEVRAALKNTLCTLEKARTTLNLLQEEDASLAAALARAVEEKAAQKAATEHGDADSADSNTASASPPPPAASPTQQNEVAWPTAEQVQGSGAAWKSNAEGSGETHEAGVGENEAPHEQNGNGQNGNRPDHSDGPVHSRHHSLSGSQPAHRGWISSSSLSPHSPRHVNVRNGAGRQFVVDDEESSDTSSNPATQDETAPRRGLPGGAGEAAGVGVLGLGNSSHGAKEMPQSDPNSSGHESDTESSGPAANESKSVRVNGSSDGNANGVRINGVNGSAFASSISSEQLRSQRFDVGSNGHVQQESSSASAEDRSAASASAKLSESVSEDRSATDSPAAALDVGSDEDEEGSWLKKRKHRLPWQQ